MADFYNDPLLSSFIQRNPVTVPPFTSTTQANAVGTPTGVLIDPATGLPIPIGGKDANGVSVAALGRGSGPVNLPAGVSSAVYANYARTRAGLALTKNAIAAGISGVNFDWFDIGDSTTIGFYSLVNTNAQTNMMTKSPGVWMAAALKTAGYNGTFNLNFGDQGALLSGTALPSVVQDPRLALGSAIGSNATLTVGGGMIGTASTSATGLAVFTPLEPCDTYEVFYPQSPTLNGTLTISMAGASNQVLNNNNSGVAAAGIYARAVITGTLGAALSLQGTSGTTFYCGIRGSRSDQSQVRVNNVGIGSSQARDWIVSTYGYSPLPGLASLVGFNPGKACCRINLGINEWLGTGGATTPAQFQTNLQTLVSSILPYMDVILETPFPSAQSGTLLSVQAPYVAVIKAVAAANNLLLNDMWGGLGCQETYAALGYFNNINHPQFPLYEMKGIAGARLLETIGT